jgi:hypothetical protein
MDLKDEQLGIIQEWAATTRISYEDLFFGLKQNAEVARSCVNRR